MKITKHDVYTLQLILGGSEKPMSRFIKYFVMKKKIYLGGVIVMIASLVFLINACTKELLGPSLDGTWIEVDNTTDQNPTGCELIINQSEGYVSLCGMNVLQPYNAISLLAEKRARLFIRDGQLFFREKKSSLLWIVPILKEDLYFMDFDIDGDFLWIVDENTNTKTTAKDVGKVFIRK